MIDAVVKIWASFVLPVFILMSVCFVWGMVDTFLMIRFQGKMKRGVPLFQKPLPEPTLQFLRNLSNDVIVKRKVLLGEATVGFIRVVGSERLIQARKPNWRTAWPYVAYIDLSQLTPTLEYRASLPNNLVFVCWFLVTLPVPFLWLFLGGMIYLNYYMETKGVEDFLLQQQKEHQTKGLQGE